MEKRSLIAIALSVLVFIIYYSFFFKPPVPPPPSATSSSVSSSSESIPKAKPSTPLPSASAPTFKEEELPPPKISVIKNPLYQVELSNRGGVAQNFLVQKYRVGLGKDAPPVDLIGGVSDRNLLLEFQEADFTLPPVLSYAISREGENFVEYQWKNDELILTKRIEWDSQNYSANIHVTLENLSNKTLETSLGLRLETVQNPESKQSIGFLKSPANLKYPVLYGEKGVTYHRDVKKLPARTEERGAFQWMGLEDRYFLWAIVSRALSPESRAEYGWREGGILYSELIYPKEAIPSSGKLEKEFTVYIGPKEVDRLKLLGVHLEQAVDYGWFSFVAQPILFLLKFFHRWVGNWGVAIILLTVFIKLVLHPINKRSLESMKAMQKLQPRMVELREKYQNDRERLNLEMMNLFKTHKVNPMGGCLPMLLQMPVYIALYKVLYNAIELYHAPFFGFYKDLSAPDPYFISPILLGIFMVLQQKMTPTAGQDPAQAKAMLMMPVMFSAFMLFLPSGLVIYIFVNTLMTVVQQYLHQHELSLADLIQRKRKGA
jgi:YidC/Oxa1 family membrane protein insertase